jgi:hypothetical protein
MTTKTANVVEEVFGAVTFDLEVLFLCETKERGERLLKNRTCDESSNGKPARSETVLLRVWGNNDQTPDEEREPVVEKYYARVESGPVSSINREVVSSGHAFQVDDETWEALFDAVRQSRKEFIPSTLRDRLGSSNKVSVKRPGEREMDQ